MPINFSVNDEVVTTKGVYGSVIFIDEKRGFSKLLVGGKIIQVYNNQLMKANDCTYVVCYCTDGFDTFNKRVPLPKQFRLFDFNKPLDNGLCDYCTKFIKRTCNTNFTILKIEL